VPEVKWVHHTISNPLPTQYTLYGLPADHVPVTVHCTVIFGWHVAVVVHGTAAAAVAITEVFELYSSTDKACVDVIILFCYHAVSVDVRSLSYAYNHCSRGREGGGGGGGGGGEYRVVTQDSRIDFSRPADDVRLRRHHRVGG